MNSRISGLGQAEDGCGKLVRHAPEVTSKRLWIAIGPGSKVPAAVAFETFEELGRKLIKEFDIWPVVFGGEEDKDDWRLASRGNGAAAVQLVCSNSLRALRLAMGDTPLFVGNDAMLARHGSRMRGDLSSRERPGTLFLRVKGTRFSNHNRL